MSLVVCVVAEALQDAKVVRSLVNRVASRANNEALSIRLAAPTSSAYNDIHFIAWKSLVATMREHRVKPRQGHFGKQPGQPDASAAANALLLIRSWLKSSKLQVDLVVLQRDIDNQKARKDGLDQARKAVPIDCPIIVGAAEPKVEAWAICAFEPVDSDREGKARIEELRKELGGDPRLITHTLHASEEGAKRNAKRVLGKLIGAGDQAFTPLCATTSLEILLERGKENGLYLFLHEAQRALVNSITSRDPGASGGWTL